MTIGDTKQKEVIDVEDDNETIMQWKKLVFMDNHNSIEMLL